MLTRAQLDSLMNAVGSPAAPLEWFKWLPVGAGPLRWLVGAVKWLVVILWAVVFIWIWFSAFIVLFAWEYIVFARAPQASASEKKPQPAQAGVSPAPQTPSGETGKPPHAQ